MNTLAAISLADAKIHLKIDDDDEIEDNYIQNLIFTAEGYCEQRINRKLDDVFIDYGQMPKTLRQYILVVMTEMHKNRELTTDRPIKLNPFYDHMIDEFIDYSKGQ